MRNWKTTLAGVGAMLAVVVKVLTSDSMTPTNEDVAAFFVGIGLLFAKDYNVTGGTTPQ